MKFYFLSFKRYVIFIFFFATLPVFALQEGKFNINTKSIEAMLNGVDVKILSYEGDAISYKAEIEDNGKVSIIEDTNNVARFKNSYPVKGSVTLLVPKNMILESCRLYLTSSTVILESIKAIYFVSTMCLGSVDIKDSTFKCSSFSLSSSTLNFSGELTTTSDFCFAEGIASISLKGKFSDYNFFYPYETFSSLTLDGQLCQKCDKYPIDKKKRKRLGITQTASKTVLNFVN